MSMPKQLTDEEFIKHLTELQPEIFAYIHSCMPNVIGKQDVLQETCIVLWKKRENFEAGTSFKAWAFKTAYFQVMAHLKTKKRKKQVAMDDDILEILATESEYRSPHYNRVEALQCCMDRLEQRDKDLVMAHYENRGGLSEYAKEVNSSVGRLKHALIRVRSVLKECIQNHMQTSVAD